MGEVVQPQDYGIVLPSGSPEREFVNQALLEIVEDGTYGQIYRRLFRDLDRVQRVRII